MAGEADSKEVSVQNEAAEVSGSQSLQDLAGCCICATFNRKVLRGFKGVGGTIGKGLQ